MGTRAGDIDVAVDGKVTGSCGTVVNANAQTGVKRHGYIAKDHIATTLEPDAVTRVTGYAQVPYFDLCFSVALYRNDQQVIAVAVEGSAYKIKDGVAGDVHRFDSAARITRAA